MSRVATSNGALVAAVRQLLATVLIKKSHRQSPSRVWRFPNFSKGMQREFPKIEMEMFRVLRDEWKRLAPTAFAELGEKLTVKQVRAFLLQNFDVDPKNNLAVKVLWEPLSMEQRAALLEDVFQKKTYSRTSRQSY
jgi:hypothetical protein